MLKYNKVLYNNELNQIKEMILKVWILKYVFNEKRNLQIFQKWIQKCI